MTYFLIVYDRARHAIVEREDFPEEQRERAWAARDGLVRKYASGPSLEVVLFGSASESELRATHGRYFERDSPSSL